MSKSATATHSASKFTMETLKGAWSFVSVQHIKLLALHLKGAGVGFDEFLSSTDIK